MKKYLFIVSLIGVCYSQNDNSLGSKNFDANKYLEEFVKDYTSTAKYKLVNYCLDYTKYMIQESSVTSSDLKVLKGTRFYKSVSHLFTQHVDMISTISDITEIVGIATETKEINTYKELKDFVSKKQKDFYSQRELLKSHLDACKHEKSIDRFNDIYKKTKNLSIELAILFIRYEKEVGFDKNLSTNN